MDFFVGLAKRNYKLDMHYEIYTTNFYRWKDACIHWSKGRGVSCIPCMFFICLNLKNLTVAKQVTVWFFLKSRRRKSILKAIASAKFSPYSYNTCNIILFGERRRNNCLFFSKYRQLHYMHMNNQDRVFTDKNHA